MAFAKDRRGTAAIEFALVAPIMALMIVGLADTVRRNLAMIDLDAAAHQAVLMAVARGPDAMRSAPGITAVRIIECTRPPGRAAGCGPLPAGRYAAVTASRRVPSLFGPGRDPDLRARVLVRLP